MKLNEQAERGKHGTGICGAGSPAAQGRATPAPARRPPAHNPPAGSPASSGSSPAKRSNRRIEPPRTKKWGFEPNFDLTPVTSISCREPIFPFSSPSKPPKPSDRALLPGFSPPPADHRPRTSDQQRPGLSPVSRSAAEWTQADCPSSNQTATRPRTSDPSPTAPFAPA